jgi:hypothetical protein
MQDLTRSEYGEKYDAYCSIQDYMAVKCNPSISSKHSSLIYSTGLSHLPRVLDLQYYIFSIHHPPGLLLWVMKEDVAPPDELPLHIIGHELAHPIVEIVVPIWMDLGEIPVEEPVYLASGVQVEVDPEFPVVASLRPVHHDLTHVGFEVADVGLGWQCLMGLLEGSVEPLLLDKEVKAGVKAAQLYETRDVNLEFVHGPARI